MSPSASAPVHASFPSEHLTIGAGVAIFHLATARVVVCFHSRDKYYFLPKGRRNANESTNQAAEREGFEESGYRNRLLPLPMRHRQPAPDEGPVEFVTEPMWTQLMPVSARTQYLLFWYVAETVPGKVEEEYDARQRAEGGENGPRSRVYRPPPSFDPSLTLRERIKQDEVVEGNGGKGAYQPRWHEGTGVDEEELLYRSHLLSIEEARKVLRGSVMEDVVRRGWDAIQLRLRIEAEASARTIT